jgi:hypothetical protein
MKRKNWRKNSEPFDLISPGNYPGNPPVTLEMLQAAVNNAGFATGPGDKAPLRFNHPLPFEVDEEGRIGDITEVWLDGNTLMANGEFSPEAIDAMESGKWPARSVGLTNPDPELKANAWELDHVALLGKKRPGKFGLKQIQFSREGDSERTLLCFVSDCDSIKFTDGSESQKGNTMTLMQRFLELFGKLTPEQKNAAKVVLQEGGEETAEQAVAGATPVAEEAEAAAEVVEFTLEQALAEIKSLKALNEELRAKLEAVNETPAEEEEAEEEETATEVAAQASFVAKIETMHQLGYISKKKATELQGRYFQGAPKQYLDDLVTMAAGDIDRVRLSRPIGKVSEMSRDGKDDKAVFEDLCGRPPRDDAEVAAFKRHNKQVFAN